MGTRTKALVSTHDGGGRFDSRNGQQVLHYLDHDTRRRSPASKRGGARREIRAAPIAVVHVPGQYDASQPPAHDVSSLPLHIGTTSTASKAPKSRSSAQRCRFKLHHLQRLYFFQYDFQVRGCSWASNSVLAALVSPSPLMHLKAAVLCRTKVAPTARAHAETLGTLSRLDLTAHNIDHLRSRPRYTIGSDQSPTG